MALTALIAISALNIIVATAVDVQMPPSIAVFKFAYNELLVNAWARNYFIQMVVVAAILFGIAAYTPRRQR